jgi:hypothetical protein
MPRLPHMRFEWPQDNGTTYLYIYAGALTLLLLVGDLLLRKRFKKI